MAVYAVDVVEEVRHFKTLWVFATTAAEAVSKAEGGDCFEEIEEKETVLVNRTVDRESAERKE